MIPSYKRNFPVEHYQILNREVLVARTDLVPDPPLPPYLKMIELMGFLRYLKGKVNPSCVGYYATPESEWTRVLPLLASHQGMQAFVGFSKTKIEPPKFISSLGDSVIWLKPNYYSVNFSICKRKVEEIGGYMIPMGVDHSVVVDSIKTFFDRSPLPGADVYIVPTGSGVALSGIARCLGSGRIVSVCTRPIKSVQRVVQKYVPTASIRFVLGTEGPNEAPFPVHRYWEGRAWNWLAANLESIQGTICFVNLGS